MISGCPMWHRNDLDTHAKLVAMAEVELNEQAGISLYDDLEAIKKDPGLERLRRKHMRSARIFDMGRTRMARGLPIPRKLTPAEKAVERRHEKARADWRARDIAHCAEVKRAYYEHSPNSEARLLEAVHLVAQEIRRAKRTGRFVKGGEA